MKCHRCGSVMVYERFYGPGESFLGWRLILRGGLRVGVRSQHLTLLGLFDR
jgi:hypothetical protein